MLSLAWKDWERKASNFPPEVAFQLYSFHCIPLITVQLNLVVTCTDDCTCHHPEISEKNYNFTKKFKTNVGI